MGSFHKHITFKSDTEQNIFVSLNNLFRRLKILTSKLRKSVSFLAAIVIPDLKMNA